MEAAAADGRRQVVHLADVDAVVASSARLRNVRGSSERVGAEEVAAGELDLVVRHVAERRERRLEVEQVVAALLEHDHRPARAR